MSVAQLGLPSLDLSTQNETSRPMMLPDFFPHRNGHRSRSPHSIVVGFQHRSLPTNSNEGLLTIHSPLGAPCRVEVVVAYLLAGNLTTDKQTIVERPTVVPCPVGPLCHTPKFLFPHLQSTFQCTHCFPFQPLLCPPLLFRFRRWSGVSNDSD